MPIFQYTTTACVVFVSVVLSLNGRTEAVFAGYGDRNEYTVAAEKWVEENKLNDIILAVFEGERGNVALFTVSGKWNALPEDKQREMVNTLFGVWFEIREPSARTLEEIMQRARSLDVVIVDINGNKLVDVAWAAQSLAPSKATREVNGGGAGLSETEEEYISRADEYLVTLHRQDILVAQTMDGLNTQTTTMDDVKQSLEKAKFVEGAVWQGNYLNYGKLIVPSSSSELDKKLHKTHQLHTDAFNELLQYYADGGPLHIVNGQASFEAAIILSTECINDLGVITNSRRPLYNAKEDTKGHPYNLSPVLIDKDGDGKNSINDWGQMNLKEKRQQAIYNLIRANKAVTKESVDTMIRNLNDMTSLHHAYAD